MIGRSLSGLFSGLISGSLPRLSLVNGDSLAHYLSVLHRLHCRVGVSVVEKLDEAEAARVARLLVSDNCDFCNFPTLRKRFFEGAFVSLVRQSAHEELVVVEFGRPGSSDGGANLDLGVFYLGDSVQGLEGCLSVVHLNEVDPSHRSGCAIGLLKILSSNSAQLAISLEEFSDV